MSKDKVVRLGKNLVIDLLKGSRGYLYQGRMVAEGATAEATYGREEREPEFKDVGGSTGWLVGASRGLTTDMVCNKIGMNF